MRFDGFQYGSEVALAVGEKPEGGVVRRWVKMCEATNRNRPKKSARMTCGARSASG